MWNFINSINQLKNELLMVCDQNKVTMKNSSQNCLEMGKMWQGQNIGIRLCKRHSYNFGSGKLEWYMK